MIDINENKNKPSIAINYVLGLTGFLLLVGGAFLLGFAMSVLNIILIIAVIRAKKPFRVTTNLLLPFLASIISLVLAVIFVSLSPHETPLKINPVKGDLTNLRVATELYYDSAGKGAYTGFCNASTNPDWARAQTAIMAQNGGVTPTCNVSAQAWCVSSVLPDGTNWCVDSLGNSKNTRCGVIVTTACP